MRFLLLALLVLTSCIDDPLIRVRTPDADSEEDPTLLLDGGRFQQDAASSPDAGAPFEDDGGRLKLPDAAETPEEDASTDAGSRDATARPDAASRDASPADADADASTGDTGTECYTETFDPTVDLSDLESTFFNNDAFDVVLTALDRRYPGCAALLRAEASDPYTGSFTDGSSFSDAMASAMTECHEATHGWDYGHSLFYQHFDYWIRGDLQHSLGFNVDGFARSAIRFDIENNSTDLYADLYLTGDQGTRGLLELLDETNCYINGLGAIAAIGDHVQFGISGRDGAVAFLYYVVLYLRRARTTDPQLYATIQADTALKEHIKTQWLRTHFYLAYADMEPHIGIEDGNIRALLYMSHNISEISMLLGRCVDQSNCLCD